jgi:predicted metal-dependent HD superfamily phosphohydrolase
MILCGKIIMFGRMENTVPIVTKAAGYVLHLLGNRLPAWVRYHRPDHTRETVEGALRIGTAMGLHADGLEIVALAAWFHDVGYVDTVVGHEERSVAIARGFLSGEGYPAEKLSRVIGCILATQVPQRPSTLEQQVICDADVLHAGQERFFEHSELLREELELREGLRHDEATWWRINLDFLLQHPFHTFAARREFGARREENLKEVERRLQHSSSMSHTNDSLPKN